MKTETAKELQLLQDKLREMTNELNSAATRAVMIRVDLQNLLWKDKPDSPKVSVDKIARERAERIIKGCLKYAVLPVYQRGCAEEWLKEFGSTLEERTKSFIDGPLADLQKEEEEKKREWIKKEERLHKEDISRFADHCKTLADRLLAKKDTSPLKNQKEEEVCDCPRCTLEKMINEGIKSGKYARNGRAIVLNGPENIDELFENLFEGLCAAKEKSRGFFF